MEKSKHVVLPNWILFHLLLLLLLVCTSDEQFRANYEDVTGPTITIDPYRLTVEIGFTGVVTQCTWSGDVNDTLAWFDENNNPVSTNQTDRVWYDPETATISTLNAQVNDTGTYTCTVTPSDLNGTETATNSTFPYKVYVMPSYLREGIIILIINCILLLVFVAGLIHSMITDRRRLKRYSQAPTAVRS